MKKVLFFVAVALFSTAFLVTSSCDEEPDVLSCSKLAVELASAQADYTANQTKATCDDYKKALQDYIDDCDQLLQTQVDEYQDIIDGLDCSLIQ